MTLDTSGNVGIGTTSPNQTLTVQRNFNGTNVYLVDDTLDDCRISIKNDQAPATGIWCSLDLYNSSTFQRIAAVSSGAFKTDLHFIGYRSDAPAGYKTNMIIDSSGNVGIGTTAPSEKLDVSGNVQIRNGYLDMSRNFITDVSGIYFSDASGSSITLGNSAVGKSLDISSNSTSIGFNCKAEGSHSVAIGDGAIANGLTSIGHLAKASGDNATAMGYDTVASGDYSTAMGFGSIASGDNATAMGYLSDASGSLCTAIGNGGFAGTSGSDNIQFAIGVNSSQFSGNYPYPATASANNNALVILDTKNVGIGTQAPTAKLEVNGDISCNGDIRATGDIISNFTSDIRFKTNINKIENPLEKISKINGYTYDWIQSDLHPYNGKDTGIIAQEVETMDLPGIVVTRSNGYKGVKYERLIPLLLESIKSLQDTVAKQQEQINQLMEK